MEETSGKADRHKKRSISGSVFVLAGEILEGKFGEECDFVCVAMEQVPLCTYQSDSKGKSPHRISAHLLKKNYKDDLL
jgi:hypothetical protein